MSLSFDDFLFSGVKTLRKIEANRKEDEGILGDGEFLENALAQAEEKFERKYHLKVKGFDFEKVVDRVAELTGREPAEVLALGRHKKGIATRSILHLMFLGDAGIGYQPDSMGAGVKNFTTGSEYGGNPRRTTGQRL